MKTHLKKIRDRRPSKTPGYVKTSQDRQDDRFRANLARPVRHSPWATAGIGVAWFTLASLQPVLAMEKSKDEIRELTIQLGKSLKKNDLEHAKQLMAAGADPKSGYINLDIHLERHIEQNHLETAQWLIDLGASVNPNPCSWFCQRIGTPPPLITAARIGDEKMCALLIKAKAQVNEDLLGYSVLWHAIYNNHVEIVKLLIQHGVDKPQKNIVEIPFPANSILDPSFAVMQELLNHQSIAIDQRSKDEQSKINRWLCSSITDNDIDMARYAIALGANVDDDRNGISPLYRALRCGWWGKKFVKLLLRNGANPNQIGGYHRNETPLIHMIDYYQYNHDFSEKSYQRLISHGAQINATDSNGNTALHYAVNMGNKLICKALLKDGADVNAQNLSFDTPLMVATTIDYALTCELLLNNGALIHLWNLKNETVLHLAAQNQSEPICKLFLEHARKQSKGILLFLVWLRKYHYPWYQQRCVLRPHLEPFTLDFLLKLEDHSGKVAFNYWEISDLIPYYLRHEEEIHENN